MAGVKKNKTRKVEVPANQSVKSPDPFPNPLLQPVLTLPVLEGLIGQVSYALSGLVLLIFILFLLHGYRLQPFVIVDNLIPLMLNQNEELTPGIQPIFKGQEWYVKSNDHGIPVLSAIVDKDRPTGFIIPKALFPNISNPSEVALSIQSVYKGQPVIHYGFQRYDLIKDMMNLFNKALKLEYPSMPEDFQPVWAPPIYYSVDRFAVPIQNADFLFVIIESDLRTEIHIGRLTLIGKLR